MPQLRVHFTDGGAFFDPWRRQVRTNASQNSRVRAAVETVMAVAPHATYFPDFVTPTADVVDIDTNVDAVLSTPPPRLCAELGRLQPVGGPAARWLADLARGRSEALRHLGSALRAYYAHLIVPHLHLIDDAVRTDCAGGVQQYLRAGPEGLLRWLGPGMRWEPPVLVFPCRATPRCCPVAAVAVTT